MSDVGLQISINQIYALGLLSYPQFHTCHL